MIGVDTSERLRGGIDKVSRYGWQVQDTPGEMRWIDKNVLRVDRDHYQRNASTDKVSRITAEWSWLACGALIVADRNGEMWVIDGQHRLYGALRRSDITMLPCVVFLSCGVASEARGFLNANTNRKPVTAVAKQKALVTAGDELAMFVQSVIDANGLEIRDATRAVGQIKCVALCLRLACEDRSAFRVSLELASRLCSEAGIPVSERLLHALFYLHKNVASGLSGRLLERLQKKGAEVLIQAAARAQAFYVRGGASVWSRGILEELNKGLRHRFRLSSEIGDRESSDSGGVLQETETRGG